MDTRLALSLFCWRSPKFDRNHASCSRESNKFGGCGWEPSLHAQRQKASPHVLDLIEVRISLMVIFLSLGRWRRITATRVWQGERRFAAFERRIS